MPLITPVEGQFDDAIEGPNVTQNPIQTNPRAGFNFIDDEDQLLEWSEDETEEDQDEEDYDEGQAIEVDDEDWEIAERDFTKHYNRMKQHLAVRSGLAEAAAAGPVQASKSSKPTQTVVSLPAFNKSGHRPDQSVRLSQQQQLEALSKYSAKIANIEQPYMMRAGVNPKGASQFANLKDKSDRATSEQVLDPRTRIILFKMIGRGLVSEVNGCVSTGKEANVYHAISISPDSPTKRSHIALKIYKTSILIFKDRDRYVTGEYRFRRGYSKRNPRKMVRLWAEKEMRNLKRLQFAGVKCPEPIEVRENVLVMTFLGDSEGWASPRLKDASIPIESYASLYFSLLLTIRRMYHICKLVHADLSEYNILYHNSELYIIDVSQSVEHDHPNAFNFLRSDLKNVEDFFGRFGVKCIGLRRAFEFVTKGQEALNGEPEDVLTHWLEEEDLEPDPEASEEQPISSNPEDRTSKSNRAQDDAVFLQSYIPRTLNEVYDPERDIDALKIDDGKGKLIYADTIGVVAPTGESKTSTEKKNVTFADSAGSGDSSDNEEEGDEDGGEQGEAKVFKEKIPRGHRHEDKEAKKDRKKAVKEEAKERRKNKMPKAEKKKLMKNSRGG